VLGRWVNQELIITVRLGDRQIVTPEAQPQAEVGSAGLDEFFPTKRRFYLTSQKRGRNHDEEGFALERGVGPDGRLPMTCGFALAVGVRLASGSAAKVA
jgi:hypothetical protein